MLIKGSWEETLIRGQQLITAQKDEAISLLQQILVDILHRSTACNGTGRICSLFQHQHDLTSHPSLLHTNSVAN
jgi:hypothetical protein